MGKNPNLKGKKGKSAEEMRKLTRNRMAQKSEN